MRNLIELITSWGVAKGILICIDELYAGNVIAQLKKCSEEVVEATEAETVCRYNQNSIEAERALQQELGDIGVTWIMSCRAAGLDPEDCLGAAYNKIQFRTGGMKDGQFVKDEGC